MTNDPKAGESLDPEMLAAYIDQRLPPDERAAVEAKLAVDPDSYELLVELIHATEALKEEQPGEDEAADSVVRPEPQAGVVPLVPRPKRTRTWAIAGGVLAVAAALVLVVRLQPDLLQRLRGGEPVDPLMAKLVAAVGEERYIEARLTGGFKYGPLRSPLRGAGDLSSQNLSVLTALAELQNAADTNPNLDNRRAWAMARLLMGESTEAADILSSLVSEFPKDAGLSSDLSAAYLEASNTPEGAHYVPQALEAAERAIELSPALEEALYNRALSLDKLGLSAEATAAWKAFLNVARQSEWADDVRERLRRRGVAKAPSGFSPEAEREDLETTELPRVLTQVTQGAGSVDSQAILQRAQALADVQQDTLVLDAIRRILQVVPNEQVSSILRLSDGYSCLAKVRVRHGRLETNGLADDSGECARLLKEQGSPYFLWARYYEALGHYYDGNLNRSRSIASRVVTDAGALGYRFVTARALHHLAGLAYTSADYAGSLAYLAKASALVAGSGESQFATSLAQLSAASLNALGDHVGAWTHSLKATNQPVSTVAGRRFSLLASTGRAGLEQGLPRFAAVMFRAAVDNAKSTELPGLEAEGLAFLARAESALGLGSAAATVARLRELLPLVSSDGVRARLDAEASLSEADIFLLVDPGAAASAATRSLSQFKELNTNFRTASLNLALAKAARITGDTQVADSALRAGIHAIETESARIEQTTADISYRDRVWELYEEAAQRQIASGDYLQALLLLERGRSRRGREPFVFVLDDLMHIRKTTVVYHKLGDAVVRWILRDGEYEFARTELTVDGVSVLAGRLRHSWRGSRSQQDEILARLSTLLSGSRILADRWNTGEELVIVPGAGLHRVPFAALSIEKNLAIEGFAMRLASVVLSPKREAHPISSLSEMRVSIIVNDAAPGLPALPGVQRELSAIRATVPNAHVWSGSEATPTAFRRAAQESDVVHFAGHAVAVSDRPWRGFLALAPSDLDPLGRLEIREIYERRLSLRGLSLLVLSACSTGDGRTARGEAMLSIAAGFARAGVANVVSTLWDLEDRDAEALVGAFYRQLLESKAPSEAVRQVQLAAVRRGERIQSWAGLQLVSDAP